jgi:hypothetical protein
VTRRNPSASLLILLFQILFVQPATSHSSRNPSSSKCGLSFQAIGEYMSKHDARVKELGRLAKGVLKGYRFPDLKVYVEHGADPECKPATGYIAIDYESAAKGRNWEPIFVHEVLHVILEVNLPAELKNPRNTLGQELMADLLACTVFDDPNAISDVLSSFYKDPKKYLLRSNAKLITYEELHEAGLQTEREAGFDISKYPHYMLSVARTKIWKEELENKSLKHQAKVFDALLRAHLRFVQGPTKYEIELTFDDVKAMNEEFLSLFQKELDR